MFRLKNSSRNIFFYFVVLHLTIQAEKKSDTVLIAITGIHGNFYSNPFYYNIGDTLSKNGIDFIYAQTCDAFSEIETYNKKTNQKEIIGSWNERFYLAKEDVAAYINFAEKNYKNIFLAGHSLGANKVIYYLSKNFDTRVKKFILLSPANVSYMTKNVSAAEKKNIQKYIDYGQGKKVLPFYFMGWVICTANTAADWLSKILNNVHVGDGNFTQIKKIRHSDALLIGTLDNFTCGNPVDSLKNINKNFQTAEQNKLIFIEKIGHTYQQKIKKLLMKLKF